MLKKKKEKTHREAPEPRVATRTEAYDLYFMPASKTKPIVEKKIDRPCAEVGANVDQRRAWLLEMGTGDERGDVRIGEIALPNGGETRDGGVIVSRTGGCIGIGVPCRRLEHLVVKG